MSEESLSTAPVWRMPVLSIIALAMVLGMVRLGFWQLDRADQKRNIASNLETRASQATVSLSDLRADSDSDKHRFRRVSLTGRYRTNSDIFIDNQVVNGQVGYQVYTPFEVANSELIVLVGRGWASVGDSRDILPEIITNSININLEGRLNIAPEKPPIWNDKYSVSQGAVWQFLPISKVAKVLEAQVFPLVLELAPNAIDDNALIRKWPKINDQWVAKHQGYAFQWFAMAAAFFVACLVLLIRSRSSQRK